MDTGGDAFFNLACVNLQQGKRELAREHARRALLLRPDLEEQWKTVSGGGGVR